MNLSSTTPTAPLPPAHAPASPDSAPPDPAAVQSWLRDLQETICAALAVEETDPAVAWRRDSWTRPPGSPLQGGGLTCVLSGGEVLEKAGVNFSDVHGEALPPAATARKPELAGSPYRAMGVSLVLHPRNPYAPTTHANLRFFLARPPASDPVWWFGGGFDLTPYYPFPEDVLHWHRTARAACEPFGAHLYPRFKDQCDRYFFLPHRGETRGVGGLFFDDFQEGGFSPAFALARSIGGHFLPAYLPILQRRRSLPWGPRERAFQEYRRGRYVEFNLLYDRGTLFGLQSGGRTEAILMSLPPVVRWSYDYQPPPGSPEADLSSHYLQPRDWLSPLPT